MRSCRSVELMIGQLLFISFVVVGYPPPTSEDIHTAYIDKLIGPIVESGDYLALPRMSQTPRYPTHVQLFDCMGVKERAVIEDHGGERSYAGYHCIFEVAPNAEPSFSTYGFFRFDGVRWRFYGAMLQEHMPRAGDFLQFHNGGEIVTKPGALDYDGMPRNAVNYGVDPYEGLFDSTPRGGGMTNY